MKLSSLTLSLLMTLAGCTAIPGHTCPAVDPSLPTKQRAAKKIPAKGERDDDHLGDYFSSSEYQSDFAKAFKEHPLFVIAVAKHGIHFGKVVPESFLSMKEGKGAALAGHFALMHVQLSSEMDELLRKYPNAPAEERDVVRLLAQNNARHAALFRAVLERKVSVRGAPELKKIPALDEEMASLLTRFPTPFSEAIALIFAPNTRMEADAASKGEGDVSETE